MTAHASLTPQVHLIRIGEDGIVDEAGWDILAVADGIIFGCHTHMGGPSWQFKRFADTSIRAWRPTQWRDKLAGGFTNSTGMSGDKFSTLTYFWTLAMQQGMVWIGSGMKPAIAYDKAAPRESLNYMSGYGGAMATNPFDDPQDMSPADLATAAAAFGQRFAIFLATGKTPNTPTSTSLRTNASNHLRRRCGVVITSLSRGDDAMDGIADVGASWVGSPLAHLFARRRCS